MVIISKLSVWWHGHKKTVKDAAIGAAVTGGNVPQAVLGAITSDLLTPERKGIVEGLTYDLSAIRLHLQAARYGDALACIADAETQWEQLKASFVRRE